MKEQKIKELLASIKNEEEVFLNFLGSKFPLFYKSNFFFRDLEYGIKSYFERKNKYLSIAENVRLAEELGEYFEGKEYFVKVNNGAWKINLPQFVTTKPGDPF